MHPLLNLARAALETEGLVTPDKSSQFWHLLAGLFSSDPAVVHHTALQLRQTLVNLIRNRMEDDAVCLIDEILQHGLVNRFRYLLEISSANPITINRIENMKTEILRILHLCLHGSVEQKQAIAQNGIHSSLAMALGSQLTEVRLMALQCLAMIAEDPDSDATIFEHLVHFVGVSLKYRQTAMTRQGLHALHSFIVAHRWLLWDRLSYMMPALRLGLELGDQEINYLILVLLRELTSGRLLALSPISTPSWLDAGNRNLPSIRKSIEMIEEIPRSKTSVQASCEIVHSPIALRVINLMESSNEAMAYEAAMIMRNIIRVAPFVASKLKEMGCVDGLFKVLGSLNYYRNGPSCSSVITESIVAILAVIYDFMTVCPASISALKDKRASSGQGVSLILSLSQSGQPEIAKPAVIILKLMFSK